MAKRKAISHQSLAVSKKKGESSSFSSVTETPMKKSLPQSIPRKDSGQAGQATNEPQTMEELLKNVGYTLKV